MIFLLVAMLLMVTMGYVLTYLLPSKQKSVVFSVDSTRAFFLAQSGVEFAVRYATDQGWSSPASLLGLNSPGVNQRNFAGGRFTIVYDRIQDRLTSLGEIPNLGQRSVTVSSFSGFVSGGLILVPPLPCWTTPRSVLTFRMRNAGSIQLTLTSFSASWGQPPARTLNQILMNGIQKFAGMYGSGGGVGNFTPPGNTQVVAPGQEVTVRLTFSGNINPNAFVNITFYTSSGTAYNLTLDPENDGFPSCP